MGNARRPLLPWLAGAVCLVLGLGPARAALEHADRADEPQWVELGELALAGVGWDERSGPYQRLPNAQRQAVEPRTWASSLAPAGLHATFETDADALTLEWKRRDAIELDGNQVAIGDALTETARGFDLYLRERAGWRFVRSVNAEPDADGVRRAVLFEGLERETRTLRLYLPLAGELEHARIRGSAECLLEPALVDDARRGHAVVMFGGPTLAGATAVRPGLAPSAMLGRALGRETVSLGFDTSDLLALHFGALLAEQNAAVFVFDLLGDCELERLEAELEPFLRGLRAARPWAQVVLLDRPDPPAVVLDPRLAQAFADKRRELHRTVERLNRSDVTGLHVLETPLDESDQLPFELGSVDGTLPDTAAFGLRFVQLARALEPMLLDSEDRR